jgi:hypothetical protein
LRDETPARDEALGEEARLVGIGARASLHAHIPTVVHGAMVCKPY